MNIKTLKKAIKINSQIDTLDKEIIEIDKMAMLIANEDAMFSFSLDGLRPEKEEEKKESDDHGTDAYSYGMMQDILRRYNQPFMMGWADVGKDKKKDKKTFSIKYSISTSVSLQILGVLLLDKQSKRTHLISQISKLGVSL